MKTPPIKGPATEANAKTPPKEPKRSGRWSRRETRDRIVRMERKIPEAPTPWKALPKIRTFMLGATPQIREPISNIMMQVRLHGVR